ncbi:phage antirepressor N-terminal domain-containing protein [Serratia silvae]|uniref:Phage antirepressor Ant n=1 Tax=Serratia silvae TaxID=2824122 RepID=A0ABT0K8Z3_9GAMM|nr:phage antirepressor N-terminal domain-containing protein [Serratia silvae]MCL1028508.1 phage antirepressor Ant [Serratia silvae]
MPHLAFSVPFHGSPIYIVKHYGKPYIPMKPIVEGMGMDWQRQRAKLKGQFNTHIKKFTIQPSIDSQPTTFICLALDNFSDWMQTVCPNKVNPQIRDKVIQYQCECDDFLHGSWAKGESRQIPHSATEERTPLQTAVNRITEKYGLSYQAIYKIIHRKLGTKHRDELTERQSIEAIDHLLAKVIAGEFLDKQDDLPASVPKQFTDDELCELCWLWSYTHHMANYMLDVEPILKAAEHRLTGAYYSMPRESIRVRNAARRMLQRETMHIECDQWRDDNWRVLNRMRIDPPAK